MASPSTESEARRPACARRLDRACAKGMWRRGEKIAGASIPLSLHLAASRPADEGYCPHAWCIIRLGTRRRRRLAAREQALDDLTRVTAARG